MLKTTCWKQKEKKHLKMNKDRSGKMKILILTNECINNVYTLFKF